MLPVDRTRVVDLTNVLAGRLCGYPLARMGVEVIVTGAPLDGQVVVEHAQVRWLVPREVDERRVVA